MGKLSVIHHEPDALTTSDADPETVTYYNTFHADYDSKTRHLDMSENWTAFTRKLPVRASILDIGCSTGRDLLYFQAAGYLVEGLEPSKKLAEIARSRTDVPIFNISAEALSFQDRYDGVWACASLLHVKKSSFKNTLKVIIRSLKPGGYFYFSLKQGVGEIRAEDGRLFSYYTEQELRSLIDDLPEAELIDFWLSQDSARREDLTWLNCTVRRAAT